MKPIALLLVSALAAGLSYAQTESQDASPPARSTPSTLVVDRGQPRPPATAFPDRGQPQWTPKTTRATAAAADRTATPRQISQPDPNRVHWDAQPGQPIWIRGSDYKASFGPDGFQFIPFLGSQAPQNYPLHLDLERVQSGGSVWPIRDQATVRRTDERVVLDHGSVQVVYAVDRRSIEQFFHLGEVTQAGDITLQLSLDTSLTAAAEDGGWSFATDLGGVRYTQAIVFDEAGQREALSTQVEGSHLRITVPASFVASAQGAITVDPVLSTFVVDHLASREFTQPDVAYSYTNDVYLMVYEEAFSAADHDIYSVHVDGQTDLVSNGRYVDITTAVWNEPSVAYQINDDTFMIVATVADAATPTQYGVRGRMRNSVDTTISSAFVIDGPGGGYTARTPDIGGDTFPSSSSYFCIVWERDYGADSDIWYAMYDGTGAVFLAPAVLHFSTDYNLQKPKVSKSTGGIWGQSIFNVAWLADAITPGLDNGVLVQQLTYQGNAINNRFFAVHHPTDEYFDLDVSECVAETNGNLAGRYYIVAFDDAGSTGIDFGVALCAQDQVVDRVDVRQTEHSMIGVDRDSPSIATTADSWILTSAAYQGSDTWNIACTALQPVVGRVGLSEVPFVVDTVTDTLNDFQHIGSASTVSGGAPASWRDADLAFTNQSGGLRLMDGARVYAQGTAPAAGYQYCYGEANSTGERALIYAWGDQSTTGIKELRTARMPANQFCYLLVGSDMGFVANPGGSDGDLCLGGLLGRYNLGSEIGFTGSTGTFEFDVNPAAIRQAGGSTVGMAGQTWYFQTWFRDTPAGAGHSNFSNGVAIPLQ